MKTSTSIILTVIVLILILVILGIGYIAMNPPLMSATGNSVSTGSKSSTTTATNPDNTNSNVNTVSNKNTITSVNNMMTGKTYYVDISNFAFIPETLTINKGDTVVWTNKDSVAHTITSDSGTELNSELLPNMKSYSHTFNSAGKFAYHCRPHPFMKASVIVKA